jgi:hypothetical protein
VAGQPRGRPQAAPHVITPRSGGLDTPTLTHGADSPPQAQRACCEDVRGPECHCSLCHATFRGLTLFDAHQDADYQRDPPVICRDPADLRVDAKSRPLPQGRDGLRLVQDARGVWMTPGGLKTRQRRPPRRAMGRPARGAGDG